MYSEYTPAAQLSLSKITIWPSFIARVLDNFFFPFPKFTHIHKVQTQIYFDFVCTNTPPKSMIVTRQQYQGVDGRPCIRRWDFHAVEFELRDAGVPYSVFMSEGNDIGNSFARSLFVPSFGAFNVARKFSPRIWRTEFKVVPFRFGRAGGKRGVARPI